MSETNNSKEKCDGRRASSDMSRGVKVKNDDANRLIHEQINNVNDA